MRTGYGEFYPNFQFKGRICVSGQRRIPFRAFTATSNRLSRVLRSEVDIAPAFDPKNITPGTQSPFKKFRSVWDTGATASVITQKVVEECDLKPVGMTRVFHANGESIAEVYLVNIGLPNKVAFADAKVTKGFLRDTDVLIGMDIITQGDFAVTNTESKTVFSFRIPSVQRIDYVQEAKKGTPIRSAAPKVGRNDPCPCGSGKKYKNCCGK